MSRVENIAHQIKELLRDELTALREWFAAFDGDAWDRQMEADINAGRLDSLAERALSIMKPAGPPSCESLASPDFWTCYRALPVSVRTAADKA